MKQIGVLALQGDFEAHAAILERLDALPVLVRTPDGLDGLDGLVIPGGESTTIAMGIEREGLADPLRAFGGRILGTCAGMILLGREHLGILDITTRRNAFGRQIRSFEADLELWGEPLRAAFIRAPWAEEVGDGVEVLAEVDGHPIAVMGNNALAVAFHPEITGETRLHGWLLA